MPLCVAVGCSNNARLAQTCTSPRLQTSTRLVGDLHHRCNNIQKTIKPPQAAPLSDNTFDKNSKYFEIAKIQWSRKTSCYSIQDKFLACVVNEN